MKKDSNMFNDNSTETEGVPADKTAEIPKVEDSTEEENAKKPLMLFGREFSRKQVCAAGAGILCAALLIGGGGYAITHADWTGKANAPAVSQSKDDEDAVEKETEKAQESAKEEKSDAKTPETSDSKKSDSGSSNGSKKDNGKTTGSSDNPGNKSNSSSKKDEGKSDSKPSGGNSSNSGSNSNSGSSSKKDDTPAHQHNWVAQTKTVHHDAQYKTVHHDAVTHQVWHDAVTEEHYICNQCGADITSDPWGHINNSLMNGGNCGSYHSTYVTVKQGYYETVTDQAAYDEQVQVRDAWDETVTTGYKCSSCGATK